MLLQVTGCRSMRFGVLHCSVWQCRRWLASFQFEERSKTLLLVYHFLQTQLVCFALLTDFKQILAAFEARGTAKPTTVVKLERSENGRVSIPLLVGGGTAAIFGFGIYYLFPLSMLSLNLELLVDLFVALLLGMLLVRFLFNSFFFIKRNNTKSNSILI